MKHYFEDDTIETRRPGITRCIETIAPEIDEDAVNILISYTVIVQGGKTYLILKDH